MFRDPRYGLIGSRAKVQNARPQGRRLLLPQCLLRILWLGIEGMIPGATQEGKREPREFWCSRDRSEL